MLLYLTLGTDDVARAGRFYDPVLATLGYVRLETDPNGYGYGPQGGPTQFWINRPFDQNPASAGNGTMPAFRAPSRAAVAAFHAAALEYGGADEGAAGLRDYEPDFYAAYVRDPDANKLSAVCIRPA